MKKLAVIFPGIGYHCDKPLLYYSARLAKEAGYDTQIRVEYSYQKKGLMGDKEKMHEAFTVLYKSAQESLAEVDFSAYDEILFLSKSVGTAIACAYARDHKLIVRQVLYTPLEATFSFAPGADACSFTGTADPWVTHEEIVRLCETAKIPLTVIEDGNHSLETADAMKNIENLHKVMEVTKEFIREK